jgi:hypothetical protein
VYPGGRAEKRGLRVQQRLPSSALFAIVRDPMANRAIWNMRKRHEWLATPLKKKRVKRATRVRCGLQDALDRKAARADKSEG